MGDWLDAISGSNVVQLRAPLWWYWTRPSHRSWTMGLTANENTAEFRLHMALYLELGMRVYKALKGDY